MQGKKSIIVIPALKRWVVCNTRDYYYALIQFDNCMLMLSLFSVSMGKSQGVKY